METFKVYSCSIPSCKSYLRTTVQDIIYYLQKVYGDIDDCVLFELKVILNELILNAIKHGNKEDDNKFVKITAGIAKNNNAFFIVEDAGEGFNHICILDTEEHGNNCSDICDLKETGRGILIVNSLSDEVKYNRKGNKILVVKNLRKQH